MTSDDPSFSSSLGLVLEGLTFKNTGHLGSRYTYSYALGIRAHLLRMGAWKLNTVLGGGRSIPGIDSTNHSSKISQNHLKKPKPPEYTHIRRRPCRVLLPVLWRLKKKQGVWAHSELNKCFKNFPAILNLTFFVRWWFMTQTKVCKWLSGLQPSGIKRSLDLNHLVSGDTLPRNQDAIWVFWDAPQSKKK